MKASRQAWQAAQVAEHRLNEFHGWDRAALVAHFRRVYEIYLLMTEAGHLHGKGIIEIGGSGFPALTFACGWDRGWLIEPDVNKHLTANLVGSGIALIDRPAEDVDLPKADEVWLFNVLQHVIDPIEVVEKAKAAARCIRFFEPVNQGISHVHLHVFTMGWFQDSFGPCVKMYPGSGGVALPIHGFHTATCAYGAWTA